MENLNEREKEGERGEMIKESELSKSKLIMDSENLFYKETILHEGNPIINESKLDADMTLIPRFEEVDDDSSENKESYLPKDS